MTIDLSSAERSANQPLVAGAPDAPPLWTAQVEEGFQRLGSGAEGLSDEEARRRLAELGPNKLPEPKPRSRAALFLAQFKSFLIILLLFAALLALVVGDKKNAVVVAIVVLFNATLGFIQEHRAEAAVAALRRMLNPTARVRRGGQERVISASELVPGDVVTLEPGSRVPADGRLVSVHGLEIDESSLTGESAPVTKQVGPLADHELGVGDRTNCAFMNTVVTRGRGEVLVCATGPASEMGRLAAMLHDDGESKTPLQIQIEVLGRRLALIAGAAVAVIVVLQLLRGVPWFELIMEAVAIAVAAIPEGLPAVVTVTLAIGMHRMARQRAIVKRMSSVETLGCTTDICSDKTGTLTMNQMTVREVVLHDGCHSVSGEGYRVEGEIHCARSLALDTLLRAGALCNDSSVCNDAVAGDPTEGALWVLAAKGGLDVVDLRQREPRMAEVPFEAERKFSATLQATGVMYVKGAPEVLLERCTKLLDASGPVAMDDAARARFANANTDLAERGLRVLALAMRELGQQATQNEGKDAGLLEEVKDLVLVGMVGMLDPPRAEVREAIALCRSAGIRVRMITGDHPATGLAVARALGIPGGAKSGRELDRMSDDELENQVTEFGVLARVSPEHKLRIVSALQARGLVVAMIGDGVNDAPALKKADIGVAMGITGTEVTKEAADLVLSDDHFDTIVVAVKEGRTLYDNIVRFLRFQLSTNIGALLSIFAAPFFGLPVPFTPLQILWVNIIMDGPPAMALGVDPPHANVMRVPPRDPKARILTLARLAVLCLLGGLMATGTLFALSRGVAIRGETAGITMAFTTFVLFQVFNAFNARFERSSAFCRHVFSNGWLWTSLLVVVALQIVAVHLPAFQSVLGTTALSRGEWALSVGVAASIFVLDELRKLALRHAASRRPQAARSA